MANANLYVKLSGDDKVSGVLKTVQKQIGETAATGEKLQQIQNKFDKISNSTAPLRRKVKDIQKAMEDLAVSGNATSAEGQKMWDNLSKKAQEYNAQLKKIQESTKAVGDTPAASSGGGFDIKGIGGDLANKAGLGGVASSLGSVAAMANPATIAITAVGGTMIAAGKAAADFETHLDSLQSLTGLTDKEMKAISDGAVDMSKSFRASAGDIVDAMKLIGSQAPELLQDSAALMKVTEAANVLSEAAEIDVVDAAKAITGTMNQMGASASEATDIINTYAAASQQGAADVAYLNKAFEKAGTAASGAGMDYVQLAAAVESIAPKFSSADVAGSQLASTLLKLSMSGKSEFMPSAVGMQTALENLAKAEMDDVAIKNLVGESNVTMLKTLIQAREQFANYSESLRGTNTAYEQMATNNDNFAGAINKLKSAWDAFLITLGQSGLISGIADNIMEVMAALGEVIDVIGDIIKAFEEFGGESKSNINIATIQLNLLVEVIKGVGEVLEVIVRIAAKVFNYLTDKAKEAADWIGSKWQELKNKLGDVAFARAIINAFNRVLDAAANMVNAIKKYWNKLKEFLGMEVEANVDIKANHASDDLGKTTGTDTQKSTSGTTTGTGGKSSASGTKKGKGGTKKETKKIDYLVSVDDGTLDTAEKKLQAFTAKKKTLKIDDKEAIAKCEKDIEKWKKEVEKRKVALGLTPAIEEGSLNDIKEKIKEKQNEINLSLNTNADPDTMKRLQKELDELRKQEKAKSIELGLTPAIEEGSINHIKQQIKEKEAEIELALNTNLDASSLKELQRQLEELRAKEKAKGVELGIVSVPTIERKESDKGFAKGSLEDKKQSLANANSMVNEIKTNYSLNLIGKDEAQTQIDEINASLKELGLKQIDLHVNDDGTITTAVEDMQTYIDKMDETASQIGSLGSAFGTMGEAIGGTGGKMMEFAGQTLQATAQIIPQIVKLIAAKQAEATASGTASAAALPFPANLAAMASIIATVVSLFASIPKAFADGGVVGGSSFHGDAVWARLNSGELVLNKAQTANLYRTLKNSSASSGSVGGNVEFKISGSTLKGVLRNYDTKMGKLT